MKRHEHLRQTRRVFAIFGMAIGGVIITTVVALLFEFVIMLLWNWLMPDIFGLTKVTFWQAWGLVMLSYILFKSFPHKNHPHDSHWKKKFNQKYFADKETEQVRVNS